jgi:hypothetical protein
VVLSGGLSRGATVRVAVQGAVWFDDDGAPDDKLICGARRPSVLTRSALLAWFRAYAAARRVLGQRARVVGWAEDAR